MAFSNLLNQYSPTWCPSEFLSWYSCQIYQLDTMPYTNKEDQAGECRNKHLVLSICLKLRHHLNCPNPLILTLFCFKTILKQLDCIQLHKVCCGFVLSVHLDFQSTPELIVATNEKRIFDARYCLSVQVQGSNSMLKYLFRHQC